MRANITTGGGKVLEYLEDDTLYFALIEIAAGSLTKEELKDINKTDYNKLVRKTSNVWNVVEFNRPRALNKEEVKAVMECISIQKQKNDLILKKLVYAGFKFAFKSLNDLDLLNFNYDV